MAKETYLNGKRDLLEWQKRPTSMAKATYFNGKRDLLQWQKRLTSMAKTTYFNGNSDLLLHTPRTSCGWPSGDTVPSPGAVLKRKYETSPSMGWVVMIKAPPS